MSKPIIYSHVEQFSQDCAYERTKIEEYERLKYLEFFGLNAPSVGGQRSCSPDHPAFITAPGSRDEFPAQTLGSLWSQYTRLENKT